MTDEEDIKGFRASEIFISLFVFGNVALYGFGMLGAKTRSGLTWQGNLNLEICTTLNSLPTDRGGKIKRFSRKRKSTSIRAVTFTVRNNFG